MRVLVFGQSGQVARELARRVGPGARLLSRREADLSQPGAARAALDACEADAVINAAAFTAVDAAEAREAEAMQVNGAAAGEIARACAARELPLIHLSSDYVFDGKGRVPFSPQAPTAPLSAYGRSKLAGEEAVRAAGGVWVILRTSWVFSASGANFVTTMLRLGAERNVLDVVDDQHGGPTWAGDIARACLCIAQALRSRPELRGLYHYAGKPDVSWADFAESIFRAAGLGCTVRRVGAEQFPRPARRPANSRLACGTTRAAFGLPRPDWRAALAQVLEELESGAGEGREDAGAPLRAVAGTGQPARWNLPCTGEPK